MPGFFKIILSAFWVRIRTRRMNILYFQTGGFTIEVNSDIPFKADTFSPQINQFKVEKNSEEIITVNHFFNSEFSLDICRYNKTYDRFPWTVYQNDNTLIYEFISNFSDTHPIYRRIITNLEHTQFDIYNDAVTAKLFARGNNTSLTLFSSDQHLLSRLLAFRQGCIFHSTGISMDNKGYLFIGHSTYGKTTIAKIMSEKSTILCDERNIIRKKDRHYHLYGTWHHSDLKTVSPVSVPLKAIFFLNKSDKNQIDLVENTTDRFNKLIGCIIKPLATKEWWDLTIDIIYNVANNIDCYNLYFDKTGQISHFIETI